MARIYDNIEHKFTDGLLAIITNQGVKRLDFCVGYFNQSWKSLLIMAGYWLYPHPLQYASRKF